ncbi:MAG: hypothetical protein AAF617_04505 [Bacteroidota bacterium]
MFEIFRTKLTRLLVKKLGKRKPKPWTIKDTFFAIVTVVITFLMIFMLAKWTKNYEKKQLENSFMTIGVIEKLQPRASKTRGTEDRIFFFFVKNDTVFHRTHALDTGKISELSLNIGNCFEVKVAKQDAEIFECYFNKRVDTIIDKNQYTNHVYNTVFHKMKFE